MNPPGVERQSGFTLLEALVSMALTLAVSGAIFTLLGPQLGLVLTLPEQADMHQRVRVAVGSISAELIAAGGGAYQGRSTGPLVQFFAPVLPFRQGLRNPDPAGTFRNDVITLITVASSAPQATIAQSLQARSETIAVNDDAGCAQPACGFRAGSTALVYDDTGSYDLFSVTAVQPPLLALRHDMPDSGTVYRAGTPIVEAIVRTFARKTDPTSQTSQLVRYDGGTSSDAPVADHIVVLTFDYYGDPAAPASRPPPSAVVGPWTTYGPRAPESDVRRTSYPAGENCIFERTDSGELLPRLSALGSDTSLVRLDRAALTDGPWCPDPDSPNRYDADLLRIRRVSVVLRIESALRALRGPAGVLFASGGSARMANRYAPDLEVRFDTSPRNLNLGR